jgi:hypothetical protein
MSVSRDFLRPVKAFSKVLIFPLLAFVFLGGASAAPQTMGAITSSGDWLPTISIDDVTVTEGNSGTVAAIFTITLTPASDQTVTFAHATADGTATAPGDYLAASGTRTFNPWQTTKRVTIAVNGDTLDEASNDTFFLNLSKPTNATIGDAQGQGRIADDDPMPTLSINDIRVPEGNSGTVAAIFTISLSAPSGRQVTVDYAAADGTAQAPGDYVAIPPTARIVTAGQILRTVTVQVNGDTLFEPDESLFVNLSSPVNATIGDGQGLGTIANDDAAPPPGDAPQITVPADMTVEAESFAGAAVAYSASAVDRLGRPLPVGCDPPTDSIFSLGETTVTCTATDPEIDQTATKRFKISVVDRTPPAVRVPTGKTVRTTSRSGVVVSFAVSATDLVDGPVTATCAPAPGTRFPLGSTHVSCSAADRNGNVGLASFTVAVTLVRQARRAVLFAPLAGARLTTPPLLAWRAVPLARFYNVQLYRQGRKILTLWPYRPRLQLRSRWTHEGQVYRLRPAAYAWVVWPAFGTRANPRYGRMLGRSTFRIVAGPRIVVDPR